MNIYLSTTTAGKSGGGLKGNLRHLNSYIQTELNNGKFLSTFTDFWFSLAYPPMFTLSGVVGIEKDFKKYYDNFPYSRLNRRFKSIEITLKAPELSEHLEKEERDEYDHKLEIEYKYKGICEIDLAKIIIDKYLEALDIVKSKLKKDDVFDCEYFRALLVKTKGQISESFLESLNLEQAIKIHNETIQRAIKLRETRANLNTSKDKNLRDVRVYYVGFPTKTLYPFDYQYSEIFKNILSQKHLKCPTYHHLYIRVAQTMEEALKSSFSHEDWYINGLALIDIEKYNSSTNQEKELIVFEVISNGLRDIATIDKLATDIIEDTIITIQQKGLDTELEYRTLESHQYQLVITYFSRSREEQCPIFFKLRDKHSNKTIKIQIGRADKSQIYFWLQTVTLTNHKIKVKSSDSIEANLYLGDKPRTMEFDMKDLLK